MPRMLESMQLLISVFSNLPVFYNSHQRSSSSNICFCMNDSKQCHKKSSYQCARRFQLVYSIAFHSQVISIPGICHKNVINRIFSSNIMNASCDPSQSHNMNFRWIYAYCIQVDNRTSFARCDGGGIRCPKYVYRATDWLSMLFNVVHFEPLDSMPMVKWTKQIFVGIQKPLNWFRETQTSHNDYLLIIEFTEVNKCCSVSYPI